MPPIATHPRAAAPTRVRQPAALILARILLFGLGATGLVGGFLTVFFWTRLAVTSEAGDGPGWIFLLVPGLLAAGYGSLLVFYGSTAGRRSPHTPRRIVRGIWSAAAPYLIVALLTWNGLTAALALPFLMITALLLVKPSRRYYMSGR
ncbi:hypothetical protein [Streptomonospora litoralis]|nr:hypothetical protein [Streptomonospora litoralis]